MAEAYALYEGPFGTAIVLEAGANLVAHAHSETQLALWLGGARAWANIGDATVAYDENVGLGVNAFESHDMVLQDAAGSCLFLVFLISKHWIDARAQESDCSLRFQNPKVHIDGALRRSCWRVLDLILMGSAARQEIDNEVERLLLAAINSTKGLARYPTPTGPLLDHRLRKAIAQMRESVEKKCSIDDIAAQVGLSRAHFFALFREQLNTTPNVFWSGVRIEEAMRRVSQGAALTEVALDLGFTAPGNFSRFFKEHTGVSPSKFQRAANSYSPVTVTGVPR